MKKIILLTLLTMTILSSCKKKSEDPQPAEPYACFTLSSSYVKEGTLVTATNCSNNADRFIWEDNIGQSNTTDKNLTFSYNTAGTYTVKLTAINSSGKSKSTEQSITVYAAPLCEKNNTSQLTIDSYQKDPYNIYVNNVYKGTVSAYGVTTINVTAGYNSMKFVQASGYVLYPTEYTSNNTHVQCLSYSIQL